MPEVITFGEAMVRLSPPHHGRLEVARSLDVEVGGAELNTAAGLVRLGRSAAWVSRLPDDPLGRLVANRAREAGVDDRFVRFVPDSRCGLYFLEAGAAPRPSSVLYDRKGSAAAGIEPGMFDWAGIFAGAKWFHVSGITPALGPAVAAATAEAMRAARAAGVRVSLDLNYRAKLWPRDEAARVLGELVPLCDLLIAGEADAEHLWGITGAGFAEVARQLSERFEVLVVATTRREGAGVLRGRYAGVAFVDTEVVESAWHEVEVVDRLGAGDAFAAGLIHGLTDGDFQKAVDYGAALGALKHTVPGDLPWVTAAEVEAAVNGDGLRVRR